MLNFIFVQTNDVINVNGLFLYLLLSGPCYPMGPGPQASSGPQRLIFFSNFEIFLMHHHKQNGAYSNGGIEYLINSEFPHTFQTGEWGDRAVIPVTASWIHCFFLSQ